MQLKLCGATLAASYFLFARGLVKSDVVEYSTLSGILTAKRIPDGNAAESFSVELDFPVVPITEYDSAGDDVPIVSESLNGVSLVEIQKTTPDEDLFVRVLIT